MQTAVEYKPFRTSSHFKHNFLISIYNFLRKLRQRNHDNATNIQKIYISVQKNDSNTNMCPSKTSLLTSLIADQYDKKIIQSNQLFVINKKKIIEIHRTDHIGNA